MPTLVENLMRQIARLEKDRPEPPLLEDLRKQLAGYETAPDRSAQETYFTGRPLETPRPSADPMRPAFEAVESG